MANRYWIGGTGNWNDTAHWSETSGGAGGAVIPTSSDDVFFDANSFSANNQTVDMFVSTYGLCRNMDWSGITYTVRPLDSVKIYGNLIMSSLLDLEWDYPNF